MAYTNRKRKRNDVHTIDPHFMYKLVRNENLPALMYHVSQGADVNCVYKGEPIILTCIETGNTNMFFYLISKGADLRVKDDCLNTALHYCTLSCNKKIFKYVIRNSKDIEAVNFDGDTVLHWLSDCVLEENYKKNNISECVDLLFSYDMNMYIKNKRGYTAMDCSIEMKWNHELIIDLIRNGYMLNTLLVSYIVVFFSMSKIKKLIQHGILFDTYESEFKQRGKYTYIKNIQKYRNEAIRILLITRILKRMFFKPVLQEIYLPSMTNILNMEQIRKISNLAYQVPVFTTRTKEQLTEVLLEFYNKL